MKRFLIILAILPLLFASCVKDPYADFNATKTTAEVGETVYFTNRSLDALDYEWNFDDGNISFNFNANHAWMDPGLYTVSLSSFGKKGRVDIALMDINVIQYYCDLEITVEEYYEPFYLVSDISVRLYPTINDWINETNMIVEGFTGTNGKVLFLDVPVPFPHKRLYVDVYGPNHDNYQLAEEDAGFIETDILTPDVRNYFTALVDYYPDGKKAGMTTKALKVERKKAVENKIKRNPADRKNVDKGIQIAR